ncbi:MAG TPA: hypothetical protein DDW52_26330 [Planctomycetaceae bacterium]|nr:hypothetical protein [Planctomycetaceae bacterium]
MSLLRYLPLLLAVVGFVCVPGCGEPEETATHDESHSDHGGHGTPESLADAVHILGEQSKVISTAFTAGTPDDAHGALHEVGSTLQMLPGLAMKAGLEGEKLDELKAATTDLFDAFGALDEVMHGGEEISYDQVKDKIESAMAVLAKFDSHEGHDEHGDHDEGHDEHGDHDEGHDEDHDEHGDHDDGHGEDHK